MPQGGQNTSEAGTMAVTEWVVDSSEGKASDLIATETPASAASSCVLVSSQRLVCSANATLPRQSQTVSNPQEHHAEQRGVISSSNGSVKITEDRRTRYASGAACVMDFDKRIV